MTKTLEEAMVVVHFEHCKGCGLCVNACPQDVLYQIDGFNSKGYHPAEYRGEGCTGCGMCVWNCPAQQKDADGNKTDESALKMITNTESVTNANSSINSRRNCKSRRNGHCSY